MPLQRAQELTILFLYKHFHTFTSNSSFLRSVTVGDGGVATLCEVALSSSTHHIVQEDRSVWRTAQTRADHWQRACERERCGIDGEIHKWYTEENKPEAENPSWVHTTVASRGSHQSSHTVPYSLSRQTSTVPLQWLVESVLPSYRRTSPSLQSVREEYYLYPIKK